MKKLSKEEIEQRITRVESEMKNTSQEDNSMEHVGKIMQYHKRLENMYLLVGQFGKALDHSVRNYLRTNIMDLYSPSKRGKDVSLSYSPARTRESPTEELSDRAIEHLYGIDPKEFTSERDFYKNNKKSTK